MTRANLRRRLEDVIERAIELLDRMDGDADFETETDFDNNPISLQSADRVPPKRITRQRAA
jgi:hypothetical protein